MKKKLVRETDPAFHSCRRRSGGSLVPASRIAAEILLERLAGLSLLANDAPGAAAGGSDEGMDDLFHVRLLDCTADNGGAYDNDCYARVI